MTVPVQTIFTASTANGVTTVFPYSFKITDEEDLAVTVDGVLQTSGYTVSGVGDDTGGNVTFSVAPANGLSVVRYLAPILKREEDYQQFGDWLANIVNTDFDRIWLALQAKSQDTSRSLKLPIDTADDQTIDGSAADRAGKFISFDSYGNVTLSVLADLTVLSAVSSYMETLLDDANAATARATLGLVIGTDIGGLGTAQTWTAKQSFATTQKFQQVLEKLTITAGAPAATQNFDLLTQAIQYFTSNGANNWTLNVRGDGSNTLDSLMAVNESATLTVMATMGATPYYASAMTIDGTAVTPKWIGGTAPAAGDASCINVYTYTIIKTAATTFTVVASKAKTS